MGDAHNAVAERRSFGCRWVIVAVKVVVEGILQGDAFVVVDEELVVKASVGLTSARAMTASDSMFLFGGVFSIVEVSRGKTGVSVGL